MIGDDYRPPLQHDEWTVIDADDLAEEDGCSWCGAPLPIPGFAYCSDDCEWDHFINDVVEDREYTLDGEPVNLTTLDRENGGLTAAQRAAIIALLPGERLTISAGAASTSTLQREADR